MNNKEIWEITKKRKLTDEELEKLHVMDDKALYMCLNCGWLIQSKELGARTPFDLDSKFQPPKKKWCPNGRCEFMRISERKGLFEL
jgi:hypothetical protein